VLSLIALFLLLLAAPMIFAGLSLPQSAPTVMPPHFVLYLILALSVIYLALAAWAVLTVIGIVRLRSWSRYSILIISGGLAFQSPDIAT
jgi:hypothetical protein